MNRRALWRRLAQRPRNVRFDELESLLLMAGWELNNVRGSHHVYRFPDGSHLSIPRHGSTVHVAYVKLVLEKTREADDDQ